MAAGDLGKRLLASRRYEDVEVGDTGQKLRVRPMSALLAVRFGAAFEGMVKGDEDSPAGGVDLFAALNRDRDLLTEVLVSCCFDPDSGEIAFTREDADQVSITWAMDIVQAVTRISGLVDVEDADLKA